MTARLEMARQTLMTKTDEYARGDRLSNFKKVASFRDKTPEDALFGMVMKHIAALDDFIQDLDREVSQPLCRWDEKVGDIIVYMLLLDALVQERGDSLSPIWLNY